MPEIPAVLGVIAERVKENKKLLEEARMLVEVARDAREDTTANERLIGELEKKTALWENALKAKGIVIE